MKAENKSKSGIVQKFLMDENVLQVKYLACSPNLSPCKISLPETEEDMSWPQIFILKQHLKVSFLQFLPAIPRSGYSATSKSLICSTTMYVYTPRGNTFVFSRINLKLNNYTTLIITTARDQNFRNDPHTALGQEN